MQHLGSLLDKTMERLECTISTKLVGKTVTLQNDQVFSTSLIWDDIGYFIDVHQRDFQACLDMLQSSKGYADKTYGCHVKTIVTDNAQNMVKMKQSLEQTEDESVTIYGCPDHWLNLL